MIIVPIVFTAACLARAVIPPPRLRSKWVFFSAVLQMAERGEGWAWSWTLCWAKSLRIPAMGRAPHASPRRGLCTRCVSPFGADFQEHSRKKVMW